VSDLVIDTHAAIWYFAKAPELSQTAKNAINTTVNQGGVILLPTISLVEIVYLLDKNKLAPTTLSSLVQAMNTPGSSFVPIDLTPGIALAVRQIPRAIVPDMPDRIIAATALHSGLPLVTADHKIQGANIQTIW
jgi:PIN domain nuclease of toxin-antitoxin system